MARRTRKFLFDNTTGRLFANTSSVVAALTADDSQLGASSAADILTKIKTVDGTGSGLDADTLDGNQATAFATVASPTFTGTLTAANITISGNLTGNVTGNLNGNVTVNNAYTLPTTDGSASQVLTTDGNGNLTFEDVTSGGGSTGFEKAYRYTGTLETNTGTLKLYLHKAATLTEIDLFVNTAPSGSSINLDINKNGTSVATPSIADGNTSNTGISANVSFAVGDYITVDIDQVGSSTAGSDLYAVLTFT